MSCHDRKRLIHVRGWCSQFQSFLTMKEHSSCATLSSVMRKSSTEFWFDSENLDSWACLEVRKLTSLDRHVLSVLEPASSSHSYCSPFSLSFAHIDFQHLPNSHHGVVASNPWTRASVDIVGDRLSGSARLIFTWLFERSKKIERQLSDHFAAVAHIES